MVKNPFSVEGKVTIVTGGGTGIGASIAREFALRGAPVLIASRKLTHLEPTRDAIRDAGGRCEMVTCDVREPASCDALIAAAVEHFGRLDVLVNNAGGSFVRPTIRLTAEEWQTMIATNLDGLVFASQAAARQFIAQKSSGVIINISSSSGVYGYPGLAAYAAAKAAVNNFTISTAIEWAPLGIRINSIAPGPIEVEWTRDADEYRRQMANSRPMGRMGSVEEIAYPCIFLASEASSYISGTTLLVDGGPGMPASVLK